jgi:hypothetical protein
LFVAVSASTAHGAAKGTDRPWRVSGTATGVITPGSPTTVVIEGTVQAAHLGRTAFTNVVVGDVATFTFEAANGDTITAVGTITGPRTFISGTGRFADVTGGFTVTVTSIVFDPSNPLVFEITFEETGTISY